MSSSTVARLSDTDAMRPTSPPPATTGMLTATPASFPRLICTDSSKLDDDMSTTSAATVGVLPTNARCC